MTKLEELMCDWSPLVPIRIADEGIFMPKAWYAPETNTIVLNLQFRAEFLYSLLHELGHYIDCQMEKPDLKRYWSEGFGSAYVQSVEEKANFYGLLIAEQYGLANKFKDYLKVHQKHYSGLVDFNEGEHHEKPPIPGPSDQQRVLQEVFARIADAFQK